MNTIKLSAAFYQRVGDLVEHIKGERKVRARRVRNTEERNCAMNRCILQNRITMDFAQVEQCNVTWFKLL